MTEVPTGGAYRVTAIGAISLCTVQYSGSDVSVYCFDICCNSHDELVSFVDSVNFVFNGPKRVIHTYRIRVGLT